MFIGALLLGVGCARQIPAPEEPTSWAAEPTPPVTAVVEAASTPPATAPPPDTPTAPAVGTISAPETFTPQAPPTVAVVETATPPATPSATATADPYAGLTIADLRARSYGGGALQAEETIHVTDAFTRTLVSYESDGLTVYGFLNVPFGEGPFPVALVLHGYIPPRQYGTIGYTTRYADYLARAGYLVLHPNYRNHPPSDETAAFAAGLPEGDFRIGYAVDVLNLIAIVQQQGGRPGPLLQADAEQLHLLGHSMGGGIAIRVITVNPDIDAAVLYGSMSGDEAKNYERIRQWSGGETGATELATSPEDLQRISPIYHLSQIQAAVSIHHGELDDTVPVHWSDELCAQLRDAGKVVDCYRYPGAPHSFHDEVDRLFMQRVLEFFARY